MGKWDCFKECLVANECKKKGIYCEGQECPIQMTRFFAMECAIRMEETEKKRKANRKEKKNGRI